MDEIVPYATEQDLKDILRSFQDWMCASLETSMPTKNFTGRAYCEEKGIALYFNKREHRFSSSGLRKEVHEKEVIKNK